MDYEKLHKNTINKLQQMVNSGKITVEIARGICADFVPEIEDERIRKGLIEYFLHYPDHEITYYGLKSDSVISWLEKQGEQILANSAKTCKDEQKPADKVEPFDKYKGLTDFERTLADICIGWIGEEPGWKQYIKDNADVLLKIAIKKFNSVQDIPFEQKPAWSEDDEKMLDEMYEFFDKHKYPSLKHDINDYAKFIKSLKDRYTWKPSDKQIEAVRIAAEIGTVNNSWAMDILKSMYQDLKKLREE